MRALVFSCNIHSQHTEKGVRQDRMEQKLIGTTISTTTTTYHHHYPPSSYRWRGGEEESREEEPQKTQSHSHSYSFRSRPVILWRITNRMQGLKFNKSAIYGNLQYTSNYLQYKSNYTRRYQHGKYCRPASSTSSSATELTLLENGQLILIIQKERLTINIEVGHFSQLVLNRPSSSMCGKWPGPLENSKREE